MEKLDEQLHKIADEIKALKSLYDHNINASAKAINLLSQAHAMMETYRPDETPDPDYDELLEEIRKFLYGK